MTIVAMRLIVTPTRRVATQPQTSRTFFHPHHHVASSITKGSLFMKSNSFFLCLRYIASSMSESGFPQSFGCRRYSPKTPHHHMAFLESLVTSSTKLLRQSKPRVITNQLEAPRSRKMFDSRFEFAVCVFLIMRKPTYLRGEREVLDGQRDDISEYLNDTP